MTLRSLGFSPLLRPIPSQHPHLASCIYLPTHVDLALALSFFLFVFFFDENFYHFQATNVQSTVSMRLKPIFFFQLPPGPPQVSPKLNMSKVQLVTFLKNP